MLIHPQPDGVWRIDWQVPPETDADAERANGGLDRRIREVIGAETPYELVWLTAYRFSQRLADAFRVGRVFLAGDAAHVMSPFGARGLNSGVADAENLAWKLAWVLRGEAATALLDTYEAERKPVARENLAVTDATMRFLAPHGPVRRAWRNLVLRLAPRSAWFRRRVNSGRLAEPATYAVSSAGPIRARVPRPRVGGAGRVAPRRRAAARPPRTRVRRRRPACRRPGRLVETVEVGEGSPYGAAQRLARPAGRPSRGEPAARRGDAEPPSTSSSPDLVR